MIRSPQPSHTIRRATPADLPFLRAMLYEAAFWRPDAARPPLLDALAAPYLARYLDGWGRIGDLALIALAADARFVGAAWYRCFTADAPGYGYTDANTPELSIGVVAEARGGGIGAALLRALLDAARAEGFGAVSLSVEPENPALRLYQRLGFAHVGTVGGAWTMRLDLRQSGGAPNTDSETRP